MLQTGSSLKNIGPLLKNPVIFQRGYGVRSNYRIYRRQRGRGIGNIFAGLYKYFQPLIVKGLKSIAKEVLLTGTDIVQNSEKQPLPELIKTQSRKAYENLKRKAINKLDPLMKGSGFKTIKGGAKRLKISQALVATRKPPSRKEQKKKLRNKDIFD